MAITFAQEKKRQRYLILVLALVILLILIVIWRGLFWEGTPQPTSVLPAFVPRKVEINWEALKSPQLEEFHPFEQIPPFEGEIGRENPFIPY